MQRYHMFSMCFQVIQWSFKWFSICLSTVLFFLSSRDFLKQQDVLRRVTVCGFKRCIELFPTPFLSRDFIALLSTSAMETLVVKKSMHSSLPPLLLRLCLPIPPPSPVDTPTATPSLSGSVMTCCRRSLWGRQECWCFRLALKGVERVLPLLLQPLVPTAPFSAHTGTVCLFVFASSCLPLHPPFSH